VQRFPSTSRKVRGTFITLEGGEGTGKSTQTEHLLRRLRDAGVAAIGTREPGGSPDAEVLRKILLSGVAEPLGPAAEAILFSAARIDHLDRKIEPALATGTWVVCDRFADSTRAYQGVTGRLDLQFVDVLERVTLDRVRPDLTLILDLPAEEACSRAARRSGGFVGRDRFEREGLGFHRMIRKAFLTIAEAEPTRCVVIDASCAEIDISRTIWELVYRRILCESRAATHGR
jgi:dTMP kinase